MKATSISRAIPIGLNCLRWCSVNFSIGDSPESDCCYGNPYLMSNVAAAVSRSIQHSWLPRLAGVESKRIFELDGHIYAFDSTTIDLCLPVFEWTKFRKHKGGIKLRMLDDIEAKVPAFVHSIHLPIFMIQRLCRRYHTNQWRITYSTVNITISVT